LFFCGPLKKIFALGSRLQRFAQAKRRAILAQQGNIRRRQAVRVATNAPQVAFFFPSTLEEKNIDSFWVEALKRGEFIDTV
jgi:hypothetical protein